MAEIGFNSGFGQLPREKFSLNFPSVPFEVNPYPLLLHQSHKAFPSDVTIDNICWGSLRYCFCFLRIYYLKMMLEGQQVALKGCKEKGGVRKCSQTFLCFPARKPRSHPLKEVSRGSFWRFPPLSIFCNRIKSCVGTGNSRGVCVL